MIGRRPGYLNGFHGMTPRRITFHGFSAAAGKGAFEPPPEPPPEALPHVPPPGPLPRTIEEYLKTHQDKRCPEGEKTESIPCQGADCAPGEKETECRDDPIYKEVELLEEEILRQELKQIEIQEAEEKREELRRKSIARQMIQEEVLARQRTQEQAVIQKAAIFGIGGIAVLLIGTLIYKMVAG